MGNQQEIIFPSEPVQIGTPWKPEFIYPEDLGEIVLFDPQLLFKIWENPEYKFEFSGFLQGNEEEIIYKISAVLPKYFRRFVKLDV